MAKISDDVLKTAAQCRLRIGLARKTKGLKFLDDVFSQGRSRKKYFFCI